MGCPHCGSDDIRRSHTSFGLDRIGFHRCRCRVCHGLFWLRASQLEAARTRRREVEGPQGRGAAPPEPGAPPPGDERPSAPLRPATDLSALDDELSRRRADTPPH